LQRPALQEKNSLASNADKNSACEVQNPIPRSARLKKIIKKKRVMYSEIKNQDKLLLNNI
jgi:hypothetical protein